MRIKTGTSGAVKLGLVAAATMLAAVWAPASNAQADANWQRIVAAAKKEGNVVIYYQTVAPLIDRVIKDFSSVYPEIRVESKR